MGGDRPRQPRTRYHQCHEEHRAYLLYGKYDDQELSGNGKDIPARKGVLLCLEEGEEPCWKSLLIYKNFQTINIGVICPNEIVELSYFIEYKFI